MDDVSLPALVIRVVISFGVVLAVMAGAAALFRRGAGRGSGRRSGGPPVEVLARQGLSRNASVTVLRLGQRAFVLGVTDQRITLLGEADPAELEPPVPPPGFGPLAPGPVPSWSTFVEALRERTVRRS